MTSEEAAARVRAALAAGYRAVTSKGRHISTMFMRAPAKGALFVRARRVIPGQGHSTCAIGYVLYWEGKPAFEDRVKHGWLAYHPARSTAPNTGLHRTRKAAAESLLANIADFMICNARTWS